MKQYPAYADSGIEWIGEIPDSWKTAKLKRLANVRLSNIDKKSNDGELPVALCNYIDVYYNKKITSDLDFMRATAPSDKIDQLTLQAGDVIITKDSETPDDIAVPAYVPSSLPGVVCGYHLSLIRPNKGLADGNYLFRSFVANGIRDQFEIAAIRVHGGDNLVAIAIVGSFGRGDQDEHSDYDVVCVFEESGQKVFDEGISVIGPDLFGFRNIPIHHLEVKAFSQVEKHAYRHARIVFDRDGRLRRIIDRKCVFGPDERKNLFCDYLVKLSYIFDASHDFKGCWKHCKELEKAVMRGRSVYASVQKLNLLRFFMYLELLNKGFFLPPDKVLFSPWTYRLSPRLTRVRDLFVRTEDPLAFAAGLSDYLLAILREFDAQVPLPEDTYRYRISVMRRYGLLGDDAALDGVLCG